MHTIKERKNKKGQIKAQQKEKKRVYKLLLGACDLRGWGLSRARSAARTRAEAVAAGVVDMVAAQSAALGYPAAARSHLDRRTASVGAALVAAVASVLGPRCAVHA